MRARRALAASGLASVAPLLFLRIAAVVLALSLAVYWFVPASFYTATSLFVLIGFAVWLAALWRGRRG